jgi:prepilin-type N-terminal cleavage/methylation domain-containing protein
MRAPSLTSRRGFTLIELLVVIAIIAVLITLLFPATNAVFENARRAQAKNDATQIATAVSSYLADYGKLPISGGGGGGQENTQELINTLAGSNDAKLNPREITFLEVPKAKSNKNGAVDSGGGTFSGPYLDSWGEAYEVRFDDDYDNVIDVGEGLGKIRKTVAVYSKGNPKTAKTYKDPTKWIKSWE